MSFNNFNTDLESSAEDARSLHYKDFPEFESISHEIEQNLYNLNNTQLKSIKGLINQYEGQLNSNNKNGTNPSRLSGAINDSIEKITNNYKHVNELTKKLNNYLNVCESNHEDNDSLNYLRQKESLLIKLIKTSLRQFQTNQKRYESLQQNAVSQQQERHQQQQSLIDDDEHTSSQIQSQTQMSPQQQQQQQQVEINYEPVNAEELEQQTLLIQEREREIEQIGQDINYINDIYGNLEDIVHEQQFTIDSIEDNILKYNDDTHGASIELRRAERYQRRSGGRMMCCLFILLGILAFIILIGVIF